MATRTGTPIKVAPKLSPKERSALKRKLKTLNTKLKRVGGKLNKVEARIETLNEEAEYQARVMYDLENIYDKVHYQIDALMKKLNGEGK